MSSQLQADDLILINRGGTNHKCAASRLRDTSQVLNTDLLMVQRDTTLYQVEVGQLRNGGKKLLDTDYLIAERNGVQYNWQPVDVIGLVPHLNLSYKKDYLGEKNTCIELQYENARAYQSTPAQIRDPNGKIQFLGTGGEGTIQYDFTGIPDTGMFQLFGQFDFLNFANSGGLTKVEEASPGAWDSMMPSPNFEFSSRPMGTQLFKDCFFLETVPTGYPLTFIYSCEQMFMNCTVFNQAVDWSYWVTRDVENFSQMFDGALAYNQPIASLDVSKAKNMSMMFHTALDFNKPLNSWGPSLANVTNMQEMFHEAIDFDQPLNLWNTRLVTNMDGMFQKNLSFDQDISGWCVELIKSKPTNFDTQTSNNWDAVEKPNWGATC